MNPLLLTALAGQAFTMYNSVQSLKESRKQKLEEQSLRLKEAEMIAKRHKTNMLLAERSGEQTLKTSYLKYGSSFTSEGQSFVDSAEGYTNMVNNLQNMKEEADFEVSMRQREAALAGSQASAYNRAVLPTLLGSGLQFSGSFYKASGADSDLTSAEKKDLTALKRGD